MSSNCTHVTSSCPVQATLYGYRPSLAGNTFLCVLFGLLLISHLTIGFLKRTHSFTIFVSVGFFGEFVGYIGRILLHHNPWWQYAESIQIACLVIAPSFLAAGIYLTLKHVVLICGEQYSRMRAKRYPWVFVGCDMVTIVVQAVGAAVAAAAGSSGNIKTAKTGDDLIVAGITLQVATMVVFCGMIGDYMLRWKQGSHGNKKEQSGKGAVVDGHAWSDGKFKWFCISMGFAYVTILIRCIYRIHEMAGGWGGPAMRSEVDFMVLDGAMIALAGICLTAAHPGFMFGTMRKVKVGGSSMPDGRV